MPILKSNQKYVYAIELGGGVKVTGGYICSYK